MGARAVSEPVDSFVKDAANGVSVRKIVSKLRSGWRILAEDKIGLRAEVLRLRKEVATYKAALDLSTADRTRLLALLEAVSDPLDAGYFRLDMLKFGRPEHKELVERLESDCEQYFREGNYKRIVQTVLENTRVTYALPVSEEHAKPIAAYMLSCLFAWQRKFEKTQKYSYHFYFSAPVDASDLLPYDLKQGSRLLRFKQKIAIDKGRPALLTVSLMKSASAFFANAVSEILEVPIMRVSLGEGMRSVVISKWASQVAEGGATTHEHFQALPVNLDALARSQIKEIYVLVRDPRDAVFSLRKMDYAGTRYDHDESAGCHGKLDSMSEMFVSDCSIFSRWIEDWIGAAKNNQCRFKIHFIKYSDITSDILGCLSIILNDQFDEETENRARRFLAKRDGVKVPNFRKGVGREWETVLPKTVQRAVWESIPESVKTLLELVE